MGMKGRVCWMLCMLEPRNHAKLLWARTNFGRPTVNKTGKEESKKTK